MLAARQLFGTRHANITSLSNIGRTVVMTTLIIFLLLLFACTTRQVRIKAQGQRLFAADGPSMVSTEMPV